MNSSSLTILGSSGALPAYGRFPTCQYLTIQNQHFLIDCGEGAQMQLTAFDIPVHKVTHIFISHLHGDHYLGLTGLLFSMHLQKRQADLHLFSSPGLNEIILLHLKYSKSVLNYKIIFHSFNPEEKNLIWEDDVVTVETIPLIHKLACAGFLFKEKEKPRRIDKSKLRSDVLLQHIVLLKKGEDVVDDSGNIIHKNVDFTLSPNPSLSYAYCSDTAFNPSMVEQISGVDLLYHEATFMEQEIDKAIETKHSTARQSAEIARLSNVKKLIIGHFSARYRDLQPLLDEALIVFPNTFLAVEGQTFNLDA